LRRRSKTQASRNTDSNDTRSRPAAKFVPDNAPRAPARPARRPLTARSTAAGRAAEAPNPRACRRPQSRPHRRYDPPEVRTAWAGMAPAESPHPRWRHTQSRYWPTPSVRPRPRSARQMAEKTWPKPH